MAADEEAVKDYLIFKGFKATYKAFELEAKGEKDRGTQPGKLMISSFIYNNYQHFRITPLAGLALFGRLLLVCFPTAPSLYL